MTASPNTPTVVLIVEDETLVRKLGVDLFVDAGFVVIEAGTADEALQLLAVNPGVRIVFTDVNMPGSFGGITLAHKIAERWPDIGIIIVSGQNLPQSGLLPIGSRFVRKPYALDAVIKHARELMVSQTGI